MKSNKNKPEETEQIKNMEEAADREVSDAVEAASEEASDAAEAENCEEKPEVCLDKEVEELKKQAEENYNRLLRMQADFDNYRKRVAKEREEMYGAALETIVQQLLPVVDNMERATAAFKNDQLDEKYINGVEMVYKQLLEVLNKNGVKEIEALDQEFDPNLHHAVMQEPGDEADDNKIKEVFQKGYILGNRVIRPSLVKVSVKQ